VFTASLLADDHVVSLRAVWVTGNFFRVL